jgi:hypothetical protein
MNTSSIIRAKVLQYINKEEMFTSVDISNAIKGDGEWVQNREVRDWLKSNFTNDSMFADYNRMSITVCKDSVAATLYLPAYKNPDDYEPRNQHALTPSEVESIKKAKAAQPAKSTADIVQILSSPSNSGNKQVGLIRVIRSTERIKIPGALIRKLGYGPGDQIDPSKIKTDKPIPGRLIVNKDYRFSVPRGCVGWDHQPVKVLLKSDKIVFEKA